MKCHLSRQIIALLCLLFAAAIVALVPVQADDAVTLILQSGRDGYTGVEDTYLYQYAPNANYCQTSDIRVGYRQQFAGLLHFDLASVPDGVRIVGASLELYARGWGGQDMNVQAYRLLRAANPCQATWNQADLGVDWGTPGAAAPGVDRPASPESSVDTRGVSKWYTWDIAALVQDWVDGALPNDGVLLRGDSSWKPSIFFFASTQEPAQSMRPRLIITYLPPLEPTPTSSPTPPPQAPWPMFRHDAQHTGVSPYTGPSSLTLRWRLQTDGPVHSSPAVAFDGTVYVGSGDGHVYALNADGTIRWRYDTGEPVESSPALGQDGAIYVGSDSGFLYALNPDGTLRWRFATLDVVQSSPVVGTDGAIYVGSDDGRLYAVNPDGTERWRHDTVTLPPYPQLLSSPALGEDGTVYIATGRDAYLDAVNPDGTLKWQVFMSSKWARGAPAVGPDGVVYAGSDAGCLHAYDADGSHVWSCGGELPYLAIVQSSPAVGPDGTVYFGTDMRYAGPPYDPGYLYALNPDGTQKWALPTDGPVLSSPALGGDGTVYVGCHDGYLYAAAPDGSLRWAFWVGSALHSSPAIGPDNTVYIGAEDGGVYAIGPAEGTVTLTLQQGLDGYEGATDTFIYQYEPDANHCTDNGFRVGYKQQNAALLRFDLSPIPAGSRVETAVLRVHARGWSGSDMTLAAFHLLRSHEPCEATWRAAAAGTPWAAAGANQPGADRGADAEAQITTHGPGQWYSFDLTALVQDWVNGALPDHGIILRGASSRDTALFVFNSTQDEVAEWRPVLEITYSPAGQCVPQLVSPAPDAIVDNGRLDRQDDMIWDFDWSDCPGTSAYQLSVQAADAPVPTVHNTTASFYHDLCERCYVVESNRFDWEWRVRAFVLGQWGPWSAIRLFHVEPVDTDPPS